MKLTQNLLKVFVVVALLSLPAMALAQFDTGSVEAGDAGLYETLFGCEQDEGVMCILKNVLYFILAIAFIVAVIFLVIGGFRYIVSQGNEEAVQTAKGTITNAIIGIVVIVLAWIILTVVFNLISSGTAA